MPFIAIALIFSQIFLPQAQANSYAQTTFQIQQQTAFAQNTLGHYLNQDSVDAQESGSTQKKFKRWVRRLNGAIKQIAPEKLSTEQKTKLKSDVPALAKELAKKGGKRKALGAIFAGLQKASRAPDPWEYKFTWGDLTVPALAIIANGSLIAGIILCAMGLFPLGLILIGTWVVIQTVGAVAMEPEEYLWFNPYTAILMLMVGGGC